MSWWNPFKQPPKKRNMNRLNAVNNKIILIIIISSMLFLFVLNYFPTQKKMDLPKQDINYYKALVQSGLAQFSNSRAITNKDINTRLIANTPDGIYHLYESRNWNTNDYGKLFVVRED